MLHHPYILGDPQRQARGAKNEKRSPTKAAKSQVATSPLHSEGPKRGRKCYVTPAFSGIPNTKRGEQKMTSGPVQMRTKSEGATSPRPFEGPKRGRKCYVTPAFSGICNANRSKQKIRNGYQLRGTKSEVATSPLPSHGPKRGRKCYITPAFSGIPNDKRREQKMRSGCLTPYLYFFLVVRRVSK